MRAIFYIDGFNFYYRRTRQQPQYKWLNMKALADRLVPHGTTVEKVKYYTAPVSGKLDPDAPRRQQALLSALRTVPEVEIHQGRFLQGEKWAGLVKPAQARPLGYVWTQPEPDVVLVRKTEEKGSDVNLGVHLVRDAFTNAFDIAYVLTIDTDLVEPLRIVTREVGKQLCIVAPVEMKNRRVPIPSQSLVDVSTSVKYIEDADLAAAQFPDPIVRTGKKTVRKPITWV